MYPISSLRQRKGRNALTITGVALAIAMVVVMLSIGQGIETSTRALVERSGVDIYVTPGGTHPFLQDYFYLDDGRDLADALLRENDRISDASPRLLEDFFFLRVDDAGEEGELKFVNGNLRGVIPGTDTPFNMHELTAGADFTRQDDPFYDDPAFGSRNYTAWRDSDDFTAEIILNEKLFDLLGAGIGDTVRVNATLPPGSGDVAEWNATAFTFRVIGRSRSPMEGAGDASATVHLSELQYVLRRDVRDQVNKVYVKLEDGADPEEVRDWIENDFSRSDEVSAYTQEEFLEELFRFFDQFRAFATIIALVTIAISLMFISTVLSISVRQRHTEIGVLRAIGFGRGSILKLVLAEALIICAIGFVAGLALGMVVNQGIEVWMSSSEFYDTVPAGIKLTELTPVVIAQVSLLALSMGVAAGLVPAAKAALMDPAHAMRRVD